MPTSRLLTICAGDDHDAPPWSSTATATTPRRRRSSGPTATPSGRRWPSIPTHVGAKGSLSISDDELVESLENNQLRLQRERSIDLTIFSPRASWMGHHIGNEHTSRHWSEHCNDLIRRVCDLYPANFAPVCQLPQSPGRGRRVVGPRAAPVRRGDGVRRMQPEPRSVRRLVGRPAAVRRVLAAAVRRAVRARRAGDGARQRGLQSELPLDGLVLPRGGHDGVHAGAHVRALPRPSGHALGDPARRWRRPVPLGPVQGHGRGERRLGMGAARRPDVERLLRHVRVPPGGDRPARRCRADRQHPVRVRDGRRGAGHGPRDRRVLRRHQALHRSRRRSPTTNGRRSSRATSDGSIPASPSRHRRPERRP